MSTARKAGEGTRQVVNALASAIFQESAPERAINAGMGNFFGGLLGTSPEALPARVSNAQGKPGGVVMPSDAWLKANPMVPATGGASPVARATAAAQLVPQLAPQEGQGNTGLDAVIERYAAANGGVSLKEIAMLGETAKANAAVTKTTPGKATDPLMAKYDALSEAAFDKSLGEAKKIKDPVAYDSAVRQRLTDLGVILKGSNPIDQNLAPQF